MLTSARKARGAAAVEFAIVALFALVPMCTGILQVCLLLIANHQVDLAAFHAARAGAVAGGDLSVVRSAFADGLSPLLVATGDGIDGDNVAARVLEARVSGAAALALYSRVEVLSPGPAETADFSILRNGQRVIPNDALEFRSTSPGARSGRSLQVANVLQIGATWCQPLVVPFAAELLIGILRRTDATPWHHVCYAARRVPVRAMATAPMQSDFVVR